MRRLAIDPSVKKGRINKNIYGHFAEHLGRCIYGGIFAGEDSDIPNVNGIRTDIVDALRRIRIPVLRWPGGCFADEYHWQDGIGPKGSRKKMVNTHWGGVTEDNSFGTHEFMELCRQLGCEPYINGNMGSGTVREMREWVEYLTFGGVSPMADLRRQNGREEPWSVTYFGVGNESWGCGGNMRPEYYANEYRRYQTYLKDYGGNKLYKIACGASGADYRWTEVLMQNASCCMDGLSLHYYTALDWEDNKTALDFGEGEYYKLLSRALELDTVLEGHERIMDAYDPEKRIGLIVDEWGTWHAVEEGTNPGFLYQQNAMRDAIAAAVSLNILNRHCQRVQMANIAQAVNVLQAVILTNGGKMLLTPTYHVFDLYKAHQGAQLLESSIESEQTGAGVCPDLSVSASEDGNGVIHATLVNLSCDGAREVSLALEGLRTASGRILAGKPHAHNDFGDPEAVGAKHFDGFRKTARGCEFTIPACAVMEIALRR